MDLATTTSGFHEEKTGAGARHMLRVSQMFGINLANVTGGVLTCALAVVFFLGL